MCTAGAEWLAEDINFKSQTASDQLRWKITTKWPQTRVKEKEERATWASWRVQCCTVWQWTEGDGEKWSIIQPAWFAYLHQLVINPRFSGLWKECRVTSLAITFSLLACSSVFQPGWNAGATPDWAWIRNNLPYSHTVMTWLRPDHYPVALHLVSREILAKWQTI